MLACGVKERENGMAIIVFKQNISMLKSISQVSLL